MAVGVQLDRDRVEFAAGDRRVDAYGDLLKRFRD